MKYLFLLFIPTISFAHEINIHDSPTDKTKVVLELIDDCDDIHKLIIDSKDLGTSKSLKWLQKLFESGKLDKCIDK